VRSKKWDYLCPVDPEVLVTSQPCQTWRELLRQKQRWGKGGLDMKLSGLMVMVIGFGLNVLLLLSLWATSIIILCVAAMLKLCGDYAFLHTILKRQRRLGLLKYFIPFEAYFFLYVLLLPFIVFFGGPVIWKGRSY
jgi:cellulose synthase/poly-beta-1,6-N-acetylglucosamine synthase-like glycosyltransferase